MANITLGGNPITTKGTLPKVGSNAPNFELVNKELHILTLDSFSDKTILLNIVPSLDTSICMLSAKKFQEKLKDDVVFITVSRDTPFAQARACSNEHIEKALTGSDLSHKFGDDYKCTITSGPLTNLLSRAVVIINKKRVVQYIEQVPEIKQEPNYTAALECLSKI